MQELKINNDMKETGCFCSFLLLIWFSYSTNHNKAGILCICWIDSGCFHVQNGDFLCEKILYVVMKCSDSIENTLVRPNKTTAINSRNSTVVYVLKWFKLKSVAIGWWNLRLAHSPSRYFGSPRHTQKQHIWWNSFKAILH